MRDINMSDVPGVMSVREAQLAQVHEAQLGGQFYPLWCERVAPYPVLSLQAFDGPFQEPLHCAI